jgi:hypothetical protein
MTTEELERDLTMLAEPREDDERLRLAIRARLGEQVLARPRRRVRPWVASGWAAVAAAAIAAVIVALGWPGGSAGPSTADAAIIRHALRAITSPANMIVHVKETGAQDGTTVSAEWWQQTSPPHALRMIKGPVGHEIEGTSDSSKLVDPIAGVREQLARGGAQVAGTASIDGTTLYKIELPTGVIAYFDTNTYRPVYLDNPQRGGGVVRTRVVTYEELPMTPDNAKLLSGAGG